MAWNLLTQRMPLMPPPKNDYLRGIPRNKFAGLRKRRFRSYKKGLTRHFSNKRRAVSRAVPGWKPTGFKAAGWNPLPETVCCQMRFSYTFQLTSGASGVTGTGKFLRLNDIDQPMDAGATHQPYGYDQMFAMYKRWQVYGAKVECRFNGLGGTRELACITQIRTAADTTSLSGVSLDSIMERPDTNVTTLSPYGSTRTAVNSVYVDLPAVFGKTKQQYLSDEEFAYNGTTVANKAYYFISTAVYDGGATTEDCSCSMLVTYYVRWTNMVNFPQS